MQNQPLRWSLPASLLLPNHFFPNILTIIKENETNQKWGEKQQINFHEV